MFQQFSYAHVLFMLRSTLVTLELVGIAVLFGAPGSALVTGLLLSRRRAWRALAGLFVALVQGTPILVVLFLVYYGLPLIWGDLDPLMATGIALRVFSAAFLGEIWRGSITAVPRGQWESAHALGLSRYARMRTVILPQALRLAVAPSVGFLVQLVKGTSVVSIVGLTELTRAAQIVSNATFKPLPVFLTAAAIYFALNFPLTLVSRLLERRLAGSTRRLAAIIEPTQGASS